MKVHADNIGHEAGRPARVDEILDAVRGRLSPADLGILQRAQALLDAKSRAGVPIAGCAARGAEAAALLDDLGLDAETLAAGLLLAGVDDGTVEAGELEKPLGAGVVRLIQGATRIAAFKELRKAAGEGVQADRLRRMLLTIAEDPRVVLVRLAHQICALRVADTLPEAMRRTLGEETLEVYAPLANRLGVWQFKSQLEDLAIRYLEPQTYRRIDDWLAQQRDERERFVARVIAQLREELQRAGIQAEVSGRPKHIYSIWNKMRRKGLEMDRIYDVTGLRVLVEEVADCYAALGLVHSLWEPIAAEFDDYIAKPKANMYQSLHTAVTGPEGRTMEVQIRTHAMHRHADLGVAAHWRYKEGLQKRIAWSRRFLESGGEGRGASDLIERFKELAFQDRIYVLTPRGQVIDLPPGATPLDFAYAIHTEVGHRCRGAKVDGTMVPLTHALSSGRQVEILTAREGGPSRDWLNPALGYLKSESARAKARHWFKEQDHARDAAQGRAVLERERKRLHIGDVNIAGIARHFGIKEADDLLAALGRGDITGVQLAHALGEAHPAPPAPSEPAARPAPERTPGELLVLGVSNLLTRIAGCCRPVPREPIAGYITQGQGVSIHRRDCAALARLAAARPQKVVDVAWGRAGKQSYPVDIVVEAHDRRGLLRDVSDAVASEKVNILAVNTLSDQLAGTAHMTFTLEVGGIEELERVLNRIARLPDVRHARRKT